MWEAKDELELAMADYDAILVEDPNNLFAVKRQVQANELMSIYSHHSLYLHHLLYIFTPLTINISIAMADYDAILTEDPNNLFAVKRQVQAKELMRNVSHFSR